MEIEEQLRHLYHEVREKTTELLNLQKQKGSTSIDILNEEIPGVSKLVAIE